MNNQKNVPKMREIKDSNEVKIHRHETLFNF